MKKEISDDFLNDAGKIIYIQSKQRFSAESQISKIGQSLDTLSQINLQNETNLENIITQAEQLCQHRGIDTNSITQIDKDYILESVSLTKEEELDIKVEQLNILDSVEVDDGIGWEEYLSNIEKYAEKNNFDVSVDPFESLMTSAEYVEISERIRTDYRMTKAKCDKYDYLIAAFCGVASGLIDSFFVGMPGKSKLGNWTDKQTDTLVIKFSGMVWNADKKLNVSSNKKEPDTIASAIGYLERRFKVNYDARYSSDLQVGDNVLHMGPKDHHLKSLGHSPDLIGLFFSILDQFTGKASFVSDGRLIRVKPVENSFGFELDGSSFFAKLFCGFCNWIGHIISDIAGSSGTRGHDNGKRGVGVPIPFFEMFQFFNFGSFKVGDEQKNLAELMSLVFQRGYDARFGVAMAIPVAFNEIIIRLLWLIKSRYYHERSWKDSIPFGNRHELRRMLVVGYGSLCLIDGVDAAIRSTGELLTFALHLNFVAWSRFAFSALQEIRALYKENSLDIMSMEKDLEYEWKQLYGGNQ